MNDNIRVSDADRESAAERLREHFAAGRLTSEELEERLTATFSAKTEGDLRAVLTDLPAAPTAGAPAPPAGWPPPGWRQPPWARRRGGFPVRRPRLLPLLLIALIVAVAIPSVGWVAVAFVKVLLLVWLVSMVVGVLAMARCRRRLRRHWQSGFGGNWQCYQWHGR